MWTAGLSCCTLYMHMLADVLTQHAMYINDNVFTNISFFLDVDVIFNAVLFVNYSAVST